MTSWLSAVVLKPLQISMLLLAGQRVCSLLFAWVGVLLVYDRQRSIQPLSRDMASYEMLLNPS